MTRPLVGVIGGLGPLATAYFVERVVECTDASSDQDHIDQVVFSHAAIPDRTAYVLDSNAPNPGPVLAEDAQRLERFGATFLVMPCNTAHAFASYVTAAVTTPFLSIIDVTVAEVLRRSPDTTTVGFLATAGSVKAGVYAAAFESHGISLITPDDAGQDLLHSVIYDQVKAGLPSNPDTLNSLVASLVHRGASQVILGCTELSVAAVDHDLLHRPEIVDAMDQLVTATILKAGGTLR
ncbi:MAG: amino acid racemase [Cellulomonadaceae bacterium]|jgi:aspartate racemase|nr:amino acid racemase [Cellulomonadaceae bacterium]